MDIADVTKRMIRADFLRYYGLLFDIERKRFMDAETFLTITTRCRRTTVSNLCVITNKDMSSNNLHECKDITTQCILILAAVAYSARTRQVSSSESGIYQAARYEHCSNADLSLGFATA